LVLLFVHVVFSVSRQDVDKTGGRSVIGVESK